MDPKEKKEKKSEEPVSSSTSATLDLLSSKHTGFQTKLSRDDAAVQFVTIYSDRAEVTRRIVVDTEVEGVQDIVVSGFSSTVNENSFRVAGIAGSAVILEVSYEQIPPSMVPVPEEEKSQETERSKKIKEQLNNLEKESTKIDSKLNRLKEEKKWLKTYADQTLSPSKEKPLPSLEDASKFMSFFQQELTRLDMAEFQLKEELEAVREQIQIAQLNVTIKRPILNETTRQVTITLAVKSKGKVELDLSYVLDGASWTSSYDVRVDSEKKTCELTYNGVISNRTGEDWKDVNVALSNASPSLGGEPPVLRPLKVEFEVHHPPTFAPSSRGYGEAKKKEKRDRRSSISYDASEMEESFKSAQKEQAVPEVLSTTVQHTTASSTYNIPRKATIASDNKPHKVSIGIINLDANFEYVAVPSLSNKTYLKAVAKNTSSYQLLDGPMNAFMNNMFITTSKLDNTSPGETFKLYLGITHDIKVDFKPIVNKSGTSGMLKKVNSESVTHVTVITNHKSMPVEVVVFEQLPFSSDSNIKVKVDEPANYKSMEGVKLDEFSLLQWRFKIPPEKSEKVTLSYTIEYPIDKKIEFVAQFV